MTAETFLALSAEEKRAWLENPTTQGFLAWLEAGRVTALERCADASWSGKDGEAARWAGALKAVMGAQAVCVMTPANAPAMTNDEFIDPALPPSLLRSLNAHR